MSVWLLRLHNGPVKYIASLAFYTRTTHCEQIKLIRKMLMQCQPIDGNDDICYVYSDLQSDIDKLAGRIECNSDTNV